MLHVLRRTSLVHKSARTVWVLRHVVAPEKTPPNQSQRPPDLQNLQKYEVVRSPVEYKAKPVKCILLEDVEGIGHQFDVVELPRSQAHNEVLLPRKGTYASPFDLEYYGKKKEEMKAELESRVRIPYELVVVGRKLVQEMVPVHVSMDNKWTLNAEIICASLHERGIVCKPSDILLPTSSEFNGPNFDLEARLFRFYVVLNNQYVIPMIGRIAHITSDDTSDSLYPDEIKSATPEQLKMYGITKEEPYYHVSGPFSEQDDIFDIVSKRHQ